MRRALPPLYLITDGARSGEERLLEAVAAAGRGGLSMLQVREKDLPEEEVARLVRRFRAVLPPGVLLLANATGRPPDFAVRAGADGAHIGGGDLALVAAARRALPPEAFIGYSAHAVEEIAAAARAGADYASFSPVFPPRSKASARPPTGLEGLRDACRDSPIPIYALGGIGPEEVEVVRAAGAYGAASIGAILDAGDPEAAARGILRALNESAGRPAPEGPSTSPPRDHGEAG